MNLKICMENLVHDLGNGGVEEDSFAMNCYITMANKALRLLDRELSKEEKDNAAAYIELCRNSGIASLRSTLGG